MKEEEVKLKVLLVDDDPDFLYQTRFALEQAGFLVDTCESRSEAEEYLQESRPDMAVIDLMMEEDDSGFILAYRIRQQYPGLPVIILTAVTQETGRRFSQHSHAPDEWIKADLIIAKGLHPEQLIHQINQLIRSR